jgi:hypothetical protein
LASEVQFLREVSNACYVAACGVHERAASTHHTEGLTVRYALPGRHVLFRWDADLLPWKYEAQCG